MKVNNRATRLNRTMMFGTLFLGLIVIGIAFGFLYYSYDMQQTQQAQQALGDSLRVEVSDSILLME